jgi:4-amino-4-deoxy-L-arabinose transferase-like glycosyltransferase
MAAVNEVPSRHGAVMTIEGIVDVLAASRLKSALAILIVALACFLPGLATLAPFDRDETHSVLSTQRMTQSGNYTEPRLAEEPPRFLPIGIYWLEGLAAWAAGPALSSYRLPSMLGGVAAALLTWWAALAFGRPRAALLAGLLLAAGFVVAGEARVARADTVSLAAIVLSQGALARIWLRPDDEPDYLLGLLFWTGLGLGLLVQGLVAPVVVGLTIVVLAFEKGGFVWLRRLAPMAGAVWLLFLLLPWVIAWLIAAGRTDPTAEADTARLAVQSDFKVPPGIHAVVFGFVFWPGAVFAALAIPFVLDNARRRVVFFAIAWTLPAWVAIELFADRVPHSILPVCPAIAILAATAIDEDAIRRTGWFASLLRLGLVLVPLVTGVMLVGLLLPESPGNAALSALALAGSVAVAAVAWNALQIWQAPVSATALSVISAVLFYLGVFGMAVPHFASLRTAERVMAAARASLACDKPQFVATGFREPSLLLAGGGAIRLTDSPGAADFLAAGDCRAALVERGRQAAFTQSAADLGLELEVQGDVSGLNTGTLRSVSIRIVTRRDGP